jgi:hypothetical protein
MFDLVIIHFGNNKHDLNFVRLLICIIGIDALDYKLGYVAFKKANTFLPWITFIPQVSTKNLTNTSSSDPR